MSKVYTRLLRCLALATLLFTALSITPDSAHARRGFAIINTGEDIFESGPIPETAYEGLSPEDLTAAKAQMTGWQAGYKCTIFGVFWIYFHMWDCQPVVFSGDNYNDAPEFVKAVTETYQGDYSPGFWKGQMRFVLVALLLLGGVAFFFLSKDDEGSTEPQTDQ